ncbi:MAG: hypothetical protein COA79_07820 [Planctomycetota bacterium]|nr:MAG: hypothetical protein COA79_07820 [Planctomycetota bacterium]
MVSSNNYSYEKATERNIGIVDETEQKMLKGARVAIAGVGAVGGNYLITLARMGVSNFKIADPDIFEMPNLQRQAGAFLSHLNEKKVDAMKNMALDINPNISIETFDQGVNDNTVDDFLKDVDVVIDGIEAFQIAPRRLLYRKAREQGKYVMCSAPIAYGASLQIFDPNGMTFDRYYNIDDSMTRSEQIGVFLLGLAPNLLSKSMIDESKVDFEKEKGPALASTIALSTGVICSEILKLLLKRNKPKCIPHAFYMDPYNWNFVKKSRRPIPFRWLQKLLLKIAFKKFPSLKRVYDKELAGRTSSLEIKQSLMI